ncbi:spore germination protein [Paenibacillus xanthanilyticus]|uniref:Spore germination protein n=1 Tax=Paenibacillus xanthanilyticus TaxID=1783531 RepID=A0ABV8K5D5_9BACL
MLNRIKQAGARNRIQRSAGQEPNSEPLPLRTELKSNVDCMLAILKSPDDLIVRHFTIGASHLPVALMFIDSLVDKDLVQSQVMKPLLQHFENDGNDLYHQAIQLVVSEVLTSVDVEVLETQEEVLNTILGGDTVLFLGGSRQAVAIGSAGWKSRSVEEPLTESNIRGSREGFVEDLRTNISLIRRRIRDPELRILTFKVGRRAKKTIVLVYIEGVANRGIVQEAIRRIECLDIDDVEGSGTVEQWMSDSFMSPFPLIASTERPDKVTGSLMQGRLSVMVDGDPFALVLPITFSSNLQSPEDFYQNWVLATLTRILRLLAAAIATFLPALYIALLEFHHGLIPSRLAFSIAGAREGVPFPAVIEAFIMETTLELLREAGIRLPKPIGQTIGIVGGLVIGEAAVAAGIVSPIMVIVVAVTAVASFSFPSYSFAIALRILRFAMMLAASAFGLYGIILGYIMINIHFVNLKSFGIPYSTPFAPLYMQDWKDVILRAPVSYLKQRPRMLQTRDKKRLNTK